MCTFYMFKDPLEIPARPLKFLYVDCQVTQEHTHSLMVKFLDMCNQSAVSTSCP